MTPRRKMLFILAAAGSATGCHTLEGAAGGAGASYSILSHGNATPGRGDATGLAVLFALVLDPVIGALYGAGQDLMDLWYEIEDSTVPGVSWDSAEGRSLRRGGS